MIRVSVVSKNDMGKFIIKCSLFMIVLYVIVRVFSYSSILFKHNTFSAKKGLTLISEEITSISSSNPDCFLKINSNDIIAKELRMSVAVSSRNKESVEDETNLSNEIKSEEKIALDEIKDDVSTEVVSNTYKDNYNCSLEGVKIKNETNYNFDELGISSEIAVNNKNVIIYHTHTCESYTPTEVNNYESSGNYRTTDLQHSVAKVGDVLEEYLSSFGFNVIHDKTFHDYPSYSGSYGRSYTTAQNILKSCDKTDIIFDVHRDAIADESYAPKVKIGDEYAARIMFVIGTDGSGLEHPNWKHNLEYALKVQKKADEMYPGLFKPIIVRNSRYNQNLGEDATIIEIGATGNTLEECEVSAKYLANVLSKVVE